MNTQAYNQNSAALSTSDFTAKVMNYVAFAFAITAVGAYAAPYIVPANFPYMLIFIVELALVFTSHIWSQYARPMNLVIYVGFAFLSGLMLYPLLQHALKVGGTEIVAQALTATVALSLAAGIYAKTTKRDLSGIGGFLMIALIGLIVVGIMQMFWFNSMVELISSGIGILLFSAFIAYDIQMIEKYPHDRAMEASIGLYLSIFNLFTSILRFLIAMSSSE